MNRSTSSGTNAANATVELDCPWCAEQILVDQAELENGLACVACGVRVTITDPDPRSNGTELDRVAA